MAGDAIIIEIPLFFCYLITDVEVYVWTVKPLTYAVVGGVKNPFSTFITRLVAKSAAISSGIQTFNFRSAFENVQLDTDKEGALPSIEYLQVGLSEVM